MGTKAKPDLKLCKDQKKFIKQAMQPDNRDFPLDISHRAPIKPLRTHEFERRKHSISRFTTFRTIAGTMAAAAAAADAVPINVLFEKTLSVSDGRNLELPAVVAAFVAFPPNDHLQNLTFVTPIGLRTVKASIRQNGRVFLWTGLWGLCMQLNGWGVGQQLQFILTDVPNVFLVQPPLLQIGLSGISSDLGLSLIVNM
ncbi:UDP-3-O-acylglucosamine N-acyltransferase 1, partial [Striga asiatica]